MNDMVLMQKGMEGLINILGEVGAERFITKIIREPFDYTKWQRNMFDGMTVEEINEAAVNYCKNNPR